ncbi:type II CRISPR-associated endonuclease Cas1 [[Mycoplasma] phocae]|uniref:CRISPR-associated endonuclease Cas1 n=1 Tax=[Mycoplasma] phocae TaxID=142651 RepID=A0A2Z5IQR7_9BACT|nr:type II CRISPR-associated endonuclease Cas1 [[Mycoplasma] phocae]AXE60907.1 type II CRISPR-associated endonuclease Cas1 [[Mycoplasma] phocae]
MKKIIDVSESDYLSLFLGNLIIKKEQGKITIPTNNIETIIFENSRMMISVPLINKLIEEKVNIIFCDYKHLPYAHILPLNGYFNNKVFLSQIKWDDYYKSITWKRTIELKIINSLNLLKSLKIDNPKVLELLQEYSEQVKLWDTTNREGLAAKVYFRAIFSEDFIRDKDNNDDWINLFLNYGYTVMLAYVSRSIVSKGFDNRIGIFHKSFDNGFLLASDLMEPLRCFVDKIVYEGIQKRMQFQKFDFRDFKKRLFEFLQEHILIKGKAMKVVDYIDYVVKGIIENVELEDLVIGWDSK